jgi:hypothetical protein
MLFAKSTKLDESDINWATIMADAVTAAADERIGLIFARSGYAAN